MGFTAFLDGALLDTYSAPTEELQAARAVDRTSPGTLVTPCCGQRAQVRISHATTGRHNHFAHWPGARVSAECERWERKSEDHRDLQHLIYDAALAYGWDAGIERRVRTDQGYRVADVLLTAPWGQRFAIEVQLATQTDLEYRDRTLDYLTAGATPVWLHRASAAPPDPGFAVPRGGLRCLIENVDGEWQLTSDLAAQDRPSRVRFVQGQHRQVGEPLIALLAGHVTFGRSPRIPSATPLLALPAGRLRATAGVTSVRRPPVPQTVAEPLFTPPRSPEPMRRVDLNMPFGHLDIAAWRSNPTGNPSPSTTASADADRPSSPQSRTGISWARPRRPHMCS